jgi:hypothetical protein
MSEPSSEYSDIESLNTNFSTSPSLSQTSSSRSQFHSPWRRFRGYPAYQTIQSTPDYSISLSPIGRVGQSGRRRYSPLIPERSGTCGTLELLNKSFISCTQSRRRGTCTKTCRRRIKVCVTDAHFGLQLTAFRSKRWKREPRRGVTGNDLAARPRRRDRPCAIPEVSIRTGVTFVSAD